MKREIIVESLEEMCDLMCGGIEKDFDLEENFNLINNKNSKDENYNGD